MEKTNSNKNNTSSNSNSSSTNNKCEICENTASKFCSGCMLVSYCCIEHQKLDWKTHSANCKPYSVKSNEKYGRYVVASRDIGPGTIIMNEPVLTYGPKMNGRPLCLGCHKLLLTVSKNKVSSPQYKCSKCLFPMCGPECEKISIHTENECPIFASYNLPFPKIQKLHEHHPIYECILPLRCLLLKTNSPKKWKKLVAMMHHNQERQTVADVWYRNQVNVAKLLLEHCPALASKGFTDMDVHSVIGYIDVNAFEMLVNDNEVAALFDNTYIMSHKCISNAHHTFTPDLRMVVRAATQIPAGTQITSLYANILEGTQYRLRFLKDSKYFNCTCKRCADPTEAGTYFSAIKCLNPKCNLPSAPSPGYLLPEMPLNPQSNWKCSICSKQIPVEMVAKIVEPIKEALKKREKNFKEKDIIKKLELIFKKYGSVLHPNHYLLIQVNYVLCELYSKNGRKMKMDELKRKEELCKQFLSVLDILAPGLSRLRGTTMYELQSVIYLQALHEYDKKINLPSVKANLCQVIQLLEDSYRILSFDPPQSKEGKLTITIPKKLEEVRKLVEDLSKNEGSKAK